MKTIIKCFLFLTIISCSMFQEKQEHQFVYGFENEHDITKNNIDRVKQVLARRLVAFGINFKISNISEKDIVVKIRSNKLDKDRVNSILINQGKLEFWECYNAQDVVPLISMYKDSLQDNSLNDIMMSPSYFSYGASLFNGKTKDTATISNILNNKKLQKTLNLKFKYIKFLKGVPEQDGSIPYFAVKPNKSGKAIVTGENITEALQIFDQVNRPTISIQMDEQASANWEYLTGEAYKNQTKIAITVNDNVYSAPGVTSGPILGGSSQITGNYTLEEAQDLAAILSAGGRIPKLKLLQYQKSKNR